MLHYAIVPGPDNDREWNVALADVLAVDKPGSRRIQLV